MIVWWCLGGVGLLLVGWGVVSARRVLYPPLYAFAVPNPAPSYALQTLRARDGQPFDVWRFEVPSPRGRILLFHGYHANRLQLLGLASALRARDYECVLFELRGHGARPGPCTFGLKEADDAAVVLEQLAGDGAATVPIGVMGWSMGAALACQVACVQSSVRAIVVDSIYSRFYRIVKFGVRREYGLPEIPWVWCTWWMLCLALRSGLRALHPELSAAQGTQPLLVLQGGKDEVVPQAEGQAFYQRWAGPKERWVDSEAGHVMMYERDPQGYCRRVADFFDRTLALRQD